MTTVPGFSSRSTDHTFMQYPQRDEAQMSEQMGPGFSNSEPVDHAPNDNHPEVSEPDALEPGFSNGKAVKADDAEAEAKVIAEDDSTEDQPVAKKASAKKSAAKKKG